MDHQTPPGSDGGGEPSHSESSVQPALLADMLERLESVTGVDIASQEETYRTFMTGVELSVQESEFYFRLFDLHSQLTDERVVGKIRAVEAWADGESNFRLVHKSWPSMVDKLYRINIEENRLLSSPPIIETIDERAARSLGQIQRWITPGIAHEVVDDLIRTKIVVPFADGVVDVSDRLTAIIDACGLRRFRRYHAKDSGYHARHHYVLLPVRTPDGADATVALEVKILTKMQDTLGELTHLLYERKRTGQISAGKKRAVAWQFETPDFLASYVGHAGHFIEATMVDLKRKLQLLEDGPDGQS